MENYVDLDDSDMNASLDYDSDEYMLYIVLEVNGVWINYAGFICYIYWYYYTIWESILLR